MPAGERWGRPVTRVLPMDMRWESHDAARDWRDIDTGQTDADSIAFQSSGGALLC